jgi:hypothetical protein
MPIPPEIASDVRHDVASFAKASNLNWDVDLFMGYLSTILGRFSSKEKFIRDIAPSVPGASEQFAEGFFAIWDRRRSPPPPSRRRRRAPSPASESESEFSSDESGMGACAKARFVIYVAGLEDTLNTVHRVFKHFSAFGAIRTVQVNRAEKFALVEFFELKPAYLAVISKRPVMDNRLVRVGFALPVDERQLEPLREESALLEQRKAVVPEPLVFTIQGSSSSDSES